MKLQLCFLRHILLSTVVLYATGRHTVAAAPQTPIVVTLGDSITKGTRTGVTEKQTFSFLLEQSLKDSAASCQVLKRGIGGERTDQALKRLDEIIALQPRLVTVMYGTNDSFVDSGRSASRITLEAYEKNLRTIVARLLRAGVIPVLMTEPRWAANATPNGVGEHPNLRLAGYAEACRTVAARLEVPLVDHFAHWTQAEQQGQNLREWTTDGCHPNPAGHKVIAELLHPVIRAQLQPEFSPTPYRVSRETVLEYDEGDFLWYHPRAAAVPSADGVPEVIMTMQKHLYTSDHYSGTYVISTTDLGDHWTVPDGPKPLDWVHDNGVDVAVADVTPQWHPPTKRVLAVGAQVRYSPEGRQLEDQVRSNQTSYASWNPQTRIWTPWRRLEMPPDQHFDMARSACAQFVVEDDGTLLLPFYVGPSTEQPFSTMVARCRFDGDQLQFLEHGNIMTLNRNRGVYEPSLIRFQGRYYLTIRSDDHAYVTVSNDGLNYRPIQRWHFDDGSDLGSYNTQQHWVIQNNGLFLVYTRRGAANDHIPRHRAPLFIAEVDPQRLHVVRRTEQVLFPEQGAMLGNSGVARITSDETWVTVSEGLFQKDARQRGGRGATMLARVRPAAAQYSALPSVMEQLVQGDVPVKVVCFGDSVTGLYYHTGGRRTYTDAVATALSRVCPRSQVVMTNAGISGHTTRDALNRIDTDVLSEQPDVVTVMFGLNDITRVPHDEFRRNLTEIVHRIRAADADVLLCTPNPVMDTPDRPTVRLEEYCQIIRDIARQEQVPLCDVYRNLHQQRDQDADSWRLLMSDEIHPNFAGHLQIAEQIVFTLTGRPVSLSDLRPLRPAVPRTFDRIENQQSLRLLAMPPYDELFPQALKQVAPELSVEVTRWETAGRTLPQLTEQAKQLVRGQKPDLVLLAPPRAAVASGREEFIRSWLWLMNWSLSFGAAEWDVLVVHPDVAEPSPQPSDPDDVVRRLVRAQDLTLIDRTRHTPADTGELVNQWLHRAWQHRPRP